MNGDGSITPQASTQSQASYCSVMSLLSGVAPPGSSGGVARPAMRWMIPKTSTCSSSLEIASACKGTASDPIRNLSRNVNVALLGKCYQRVCNLLSMGPVDA